MTALNGAFSNVELARLRRDQIDFDHGTIRSIRGKKGRAYRKTILLPVTIAALKAYDRLSSAAPSLDALFFSTRDGMPYSRAELTRNFEGLITGAKRKGTLAVDFAKLLDTVELPPDGRRFSRLRTSFRVEAESMPASIDHDAIDLVMGHPRRHISAEDVKRFPKHRIQLVVNHVFKALFAGWTLDVEQELPDTTSPALGGPLGGARPVTDEFAKSDLEAAENVVSRGTVCRDFRQRYSSVARYDVSAAKSWGCGDPLRWSHPCWSSEEQREAHCSAS